MSYKSDLGNAKVFADNLNYYMKINNVTRKQICKDLEFPYSTLRDWSNGNAYPRIDKIEIIANYFDIKKSDLIERKDFNNVQKVDDTYTLIPVFGTIKAGTPIESQEDIIDYIGYPKVRTKGNKEFFGLKISGDSMSPKYLDGDIVIFEKVYNIDEYNNKDVAVMINGTESTFKKLEITDNGIILKPYNIDYTPLQYTKKEVAELPVKVVGVARQRRIDID